MQLYVLVHDSPEIFTLPIKKCRAMFEDMYEGIPYKKNSSVLNGDEKVMALLDEEMQL